MTHFKANYRSTDHLLHTTADYAVRLQVAVRRNRTKHEAACEICTTLKDFGVTQTRDGAAFSYHAVRAAIAGDSF